MEAAKAAKAEANNAFKEKDYETAAALYTRALKLLGADRKGGDDTEGTDGAVSGEKGEEERTLQRDLLLNRSLMNIRMELYGAALEDAEEALRVDPPSAKAYYRRGSAHVALNRMKDARAVCPRSPAAPFGSAFFVFFLPLLSLFCVCVCVYLSCYCLSFLSVGRP